MWANLFLRQSTSKRKWVELAPPPPHQTQTPDVCNTSWEVLLAPLRAEGRGKARELEAGELTHYRNWHIPQRAFGWLPSSPLAICSKKTLWNKKHRSSLSSDTAPKSSCYRGQRETGGGLGGGAPSNKEIPLSHRASESEGKNVLAK